MVRAIPRDPASPQRGSAPARQAAPSKRPQRNVECLDAVPLAVAPAGFVIPGLAPVQVFLLRGNGLGHSRALLVAAGSAWTSGLPPEPMPYPVAVLLGMGSLWTPTQWMMTIGGIN